MTSPTERSRARAITRLASLREEFGPDAAQERLTLLKAWGHRRCQSAKELSSLHESLCFARAYPDDAAVLEEVEALLDTFGSRQDVRAFATELIGQGIAGVPLYFRFYWPTARWLASRWPAQLHIDWDEMEDADALDGVLQLLMPAAESPGLEELDLGAREWIARLKRDDEGDGTFLVRRFSEARLGEKWREKVFDSLDVPLVLEPGGDTPSRTRACIPYLPGQWQTDARPRGRPHLLDEIARPPGRIQRVSPARGRELVDVAREAMITRARDLETIAYANPADVWMIEDEPGLTFVALGMLPERRYLLEATYVYLVVRNEVTVGYLQGSGLGGWAEINFNIFPPYRGRDAGFVYARSLSVIHAFQHVDTFIVDPFQLGDGNEEAIQSGAWWFYRKLGFGPEHAHARKLTQREERKLEHSRAHRTDEATLRELAGFHLRLDVGKEPLFPYLGVGPVGLHASAALSVRGGGRRALALERVSAEAAKLLDVGAGDPREGLSRREREAFKQWGPLVVSMPAVRRWSKDKKRALLDVILARSARSERDYVEALMRAPHVLTALARLSRTKARSDTRKRVA